MAVITTALDSRLRILVQTGVDAEGKPQLKTRSYNRIKTDAVDSSVYQLATTLAGLQKHSLYGVNRVNEVGLEEV